jgi:hypothetical protein
LQCLSTKFNKKLCPKNLALLVSQRVWTKIQIQEINPLVPNINPLHSNTEDNKSCSQPRENAAQQKHETRWQDKSLIFAYL